MMSGTLRKIDLTALVLVLSVSAVIAYGYATRVDKPNLQSRLELHREIITGTAPSPYRYRILVPAVAEVLTRTLARAMPDNAAFLGAYAIYDLIAISFLLVILFYWLRTWFDRDQALIGVLFVAGTIPIALQDHYFQPWSLLEAGLLTGALLAIQRRRYWLLPLIVALAALNKETAILIPITFLVTLDARRLVGSGGISNWRPALMFSGLCAIWGAAFLGLRQLLGPAPGVETIGALLARNIAKGNLLLACRNGAMFLGGLWVFAALGFRYAPAFVKRAALMVPFYLGAIFIWGVWYEVRLLMPLYPVLVPLGLSFLYLRGTWHGRGLTHGSMGYAVQPHPWGRSRKPGGSRQS